MRGRSLLPQKGERQQSPRSREQARSFRHNGSLVATAEDERGSDAPPEERGELFTTISGLPVEPLYSPENVEVDYERDLGSPGGPPFTRGVYPSMYRGRLWTMRQFAGFGTAEETNERFRYLLDHGQKIGRASCRERV